MPRSTDFFETYLDHSLEKEPTYGQRPAVPLNENGTVRAEREASRIFSVLCAVDACGIGAHVTIYADQFPEGVAEAAFKRWASVNNHAVEERILENKHTTLRFLSIEVGRITLMFPSVPKPLGEAEGTWRPSDGGVR